MIYTGYYAKLKEYENAGLQPLSIAGRAPSFYKGPQYKSFAPEYKMFMDWKKGKIDNMEYTSIFTKHLDTLDKEAVRRTLNSFDKDVILLCYEKTGDFCHRHIVADWIEKNLNMRVDEYDTGYKDKEDRLIYELISYIITYDELYEELGNKTDRFLNTLEENPPEGYFLYPTTNAEGERAYTLEHTEEFLRDFDIE